LQTVTDSKELAFFIFRVEKTHALKLEATFRSETLESAYQPTARRTSESDNRKSSP